MGEFLASVENTSDWLASALSPSAAQAIRAFAVPCLQHAHAQARYRYSLETWTNETTYGTDRYHCFASTFGSVLTEHVPGVKVVRPIDDFGSPFVVEMGGGLLYPHRYGSSASDEVDGWRLKPDSWIQSRMVKGPANGQGLLDYPGLPELPLSRIVFLAWAGNRHEGLTRAVLAKAYLDDAGRVCWRGTPEELVIPSVGAVKNTTVVDLPRHSLHVVPNLESVRPPRLNLQVRGDVTLEQLFEDESQ